jgi:hypothetical protein
MTGALGALALVLVLATPDGDASARAKLTEGIVAFGRGDLASARLRLDEAEREARDPALLSRIHRQRGIIAHADGRRLDTIIAFMRGLYFDADLSLDAREHHGEVQRLFACARSMGRSGLSEREVHARHGEAFDPPDWSCPTHAPLAGSAGQPPPAPSPPANPFVGRAPPPVEPEPETESSIWSSPWLWVVVGAAVAGGATAGVLVAGGGDVGYDGSTGVVLRLSE